jgi:flavodoxin
VLRKEEYSMNKVKVVFWSGTGNTEAMANAVANGIKAAGEPIKLEPDIDKFKEVLKDLGR